MKNYKNIICAALSALILTSCYFEYDDTETEEPENTEATSVSTQSVTDVQETEAATEAAETVTEPEDEPEPEPAPDQYYPVLPIKEDDLPSMDGSTSAIPLETGIKAKLLNLSYYWAREKVVHNKTHIAFQNLLSGETDLIFSVPISESQQQDADDAGVHLNMVPVAKEAFVFIVNKNNPVNSLTQEQIRDIYSGKITNWSELGGNDTEIIPYQRNKDSGSQNYMDEFMEGYDLPEPVESIKVGEMGDMIARVAQYDNNAEAIGYSVYSFAAQMYENSDDVKLIAIDGTEPTKETLADGTYPLLSNTYIIHRDNPSEKTERFINWILSDAGQKCVLESGYLPVEDMEFPDYMKLYKARGTGKKAPENYTLSKKVSVVSGWINTKRLKDVLKFIKDEKLREEIINDISECISEPEADDYSNREVYLYGENGFASFKIVCTDDSSDSYYKYLTYDFTEGKRITEYSDLFFRDTDYVPLMNKSAVHLITESYWGDLQPKNDFLGVTGQIDNFSVTGFQIQKKNPYYEGSKWFDFQDDYFDGTAYNFLLPAMVTGEYHDFNDYIKSTGRSAEISERSRNEWYYHSEHQENGSYRDVVTESVFHTKEETEKRNAVIQKVLDHTEEYLRSRETEEDKMDFPHNYDFYHSDSIYNVGHERNSEYYTETDLYMNVLAGFRNTKNYLSNFFRSEFDHRYAGYDPETAEPLTFADIFGPEFSDIDENYVLYTYSVSSEPNEADCVRFIYGEPYKYDGETETVEIPIVREHLNMKYFISKEECGY